MTLLIVCVITAVVTAWVTHDLQRYAEQSCTRKVFSEAERMSQRPTETVAADREQTL